MIKHGMSKDRIYELWNGIRSRCDQGLKGYEGVSYPNKWKTFLGFLDDMGDSYQEGLSIDRKKSTLDYSKENCRWVTRRVQNLNRKLKMPKSGFSGVEKFGKRFRARIYSRGVIYKEAFDTLEESHLFYLERYQELNGRLPPYWWTGGVLMKSYGGSYSE